MSGADSTQGVDISVIIPIFNEEGNIDELYRRLSRALEGMNLSYEMVFVDDGSSDSSLSSLVRLHESNKALKILSMSRNFGHHMAITAGLDYCHGKLAVLMDGDLQDQPEEIPRLLEKLREGYDVVYAIPRKKQHGLLKRSTSRLFISFMRKITHTPTDFNSSIYRIMDRTVINALKGFREQNRFVLGLIGYVGFKQTGVLVDHSQRFAGKTKYGLSKMIRLGLTTLTGFTFIPLYIASTLGLLVSASSFLAIVWLIWRKLILNLGISGWTSLMVAMFFLGGIQLLCLGILGEYIARIYSETRQRPLYIVARRWE